jgi:hypothetical protein
MELILPGLHPVKSVSVLSARIALGMLLAGVGCILFDRGQISHPAELTGKWARLRADNSWGDTLEYLADGSVRGSSTNPVPDSTTWGVVRVRSIEGFCTTKTKKISCQQFRLEGDTLVFGDIANPTFFRRAR